MATNLKNLSDYNKSNVPSAANMKFGIVVSEWNEEITEALYQGAYNTLVLNGANPNNIIKKYVPGSFELTKGSKYMAECTDVDAVICLGCVIQGETPHFDFVCNGVTQGITQLNLDYNVPFIFGLLTTLDQQQALDRAGGKHGNKGDEAAVTAIKMVQMGRSLNR
ncbi:6,7-dimethyl-8-ribityllumazine synthase [Saccharicrinis carchari]|uniref:6,7-dimethyl-8-ribityllumazine synthase n=1 Tax=Saccharicrinis carchari TaxID=1168039 RepID=A0A521AWY8_SACCC|nr:6,7-dimethyl-8-ribityllumazine synthase [Saccharicrinis carchari]SMO39347.1 6,7-dimethyl-8-ribityllumazine synthase [Saccharicrinis carchari]